MPKGVPNNGVRKKPRPRVNSWKCWLDDTLSLETDDCIIFPGATNTRGYGIFNYAGKCRLAHRYVMEMVLGRDILSNYEILHACDEPPCVNKRHLSEGTHADNIQDCVEKGRHKPSNVRGEKHGGAKLTEHQVRAILTEYVPNIVGLERLASKYNVTHITIRNIVKRKSWKHITL
jgi:hypothetical protein